MRIHEILDGIKLDESKIPSSKELKKALIKKDIHQPKAGSIQNFMHLTDHIIFQCREDLNLYQ
jgi:hypothetical protein